MDNLTHSMAGWVLGQAGLKTKSRKGLAALILGANMPDIDVFFGRFPWEPLAIHRGFTHGIVGGVLIMPPLLFGLLWLLDRWQVRRGDSFRSGLPFRAGWLLALCYLGAITHPLLDLLTSYSVQLLSPFSSAWFHADSLFIIDLFLWLLLGVSLFWSKRLEKRGGNWTRLPRIAIATTLGYIAINLVITQQANASVHAWAGARPVDALFASPPPVQFWRRDHVWREGPCYRQAQWSPIRGLGPVTECQSNGMDDPRVRAAIRRDPSLAKFLKWSVLPYARIESDRCAYRLSIGDARYGALDQESRLSRTSTLPRDAPGCPQ